MSALTAKDRRRIILGAVQIAVIASLGLYYLCALSYNIFLLCAVPVVIGILCGLAVVGRTTKEAAHKWALSIPVWWAAALLAGGTGVSKRLPLQLTGYDDLAVGDGLGYMPAIMFAVFWVSVFIGAGVWFGRYGGKSQGQIKAFLIIQAVPINMVCAAMIVGLVALNIMLPPYNSVLLHT